MKKKEPRWLQVLRVALPLCLSYVPIGMASGILLHAAGFKTISVVLLSLFVFSGGAQFMIASMLTVNASMSTILVMLFFLELRYALLGSSLSRYLKGSSNKFLLIFAVSMNDENYAVNYLKFATDKRWTPADGLMVEHYSLGFWTMANLIGSLIGGLLTINLAIVDYALTALFIYMIVMQYKNNLTILVSIISGICAIIFMSLLKSTMGLVVATLIASLIGFYLEDRLRKNGRKKGFWLKTLKPKASRKVVTKSGD